jgi:hypothetical protein
LLALAGHILKGDAPMSNMEGTTDKSMLGNGPCLATLQRHSRRLSWPEPIRTKANNPSADSAQG